ncbi:MAG: hypothetical protein HYV95_09820 [Opitutae bacterium]|nr:hypothetical protein [Opitutae bacterium]
MHSRSTPFLSAALLLGALLCSAAVGAAPPAHERFITAKHAATEANYHNDQTGLRAALAGFAALEADPDVGDHARYHAAWTEWMLAASKFQEQQPAEAVAALDSGADRLRQVLAAHPDDGEAHALLAWMLMAVYSGDRNRAAEVVPLVREHRQRALARSPTSPRVVMLDATMLFYSPQPEVRAKGLARWQETLRLLETEKNADPTLPDWGRTLADGWLANLYLTMNPPQPAEARLHAEKALRERPDFWYVKTQVLPRIGSGSP